MDATDRYRYEEEQIIGFMYGNRPLDEWDDFVQSLYDNYDLDTFEAQAAKDLKAAGYIQ